MCLKNKQLHTPALMMKDFTKMRNRQNIINNEWVSTIFPG